MSNFDTDMNDQLTVEEAEQYFTGFKFLGHGWYHDPQLKQDTMLIVAGDSANKHHFYFWMDRDPREEFAKSSDPELVKAASLPVHS